MYALPATQGTLTDKQDQVGITACYKVYVCRIVGMVLLTGFYSLEMAHPIRGAVKMSKYRAIQCVHCTCMFLDAYIAPLKNLKMAM